VRFDAFSQLVEHRPQVAQRPGRAGGRCPA